MRFPFISVRRALRAIAVATEASHHIAEDADKRWAEERDARMECEAELAFARRKYRTIVAYVEQAEGRRDADGHRLARALRAVAALRAEAAVQRRVTRRLTDQLLDATGHIGEPLLPAARVTLGLDKEDA
jgi:hypothetical protein